MKKLFLIVLLVILLAGPLLDPCYAGQAKRTILDAVQLTKASPNSDEEESGVTGDKRVAFFVTYDSTSTTGAVTAQITAAVSYDGTHWAQAYFNDFAGGTTPQSSESLSSSGNYIMWFDNTIPISYVRIRASMPNATLGGYGTDEYLTVTATLIEDK